MQNAAKEASLYGTIAGWLFIIGIVLSPCYLLGLPIGIVALVFLGIALRRVVEITQTYDAFIYYVIGCIVSCIPIVGFELMMFSISRITESLRISEFGRAVSWWRAGYYSGFLSLLLYLCVAASLGNSQGIYSDFFPVIPLALFVFLALFLIFVHIYSHATLILAFKKLETWDPTLG